MDIVKLLNAGGYVHENPEYNPKTKKGKLQPQYLVNADPNGAINQGSALADVMSQPGRQGFNLDYLGSPEKYAEYDVTISPVDTSLEKELAEEQGAIHKFGNALAQAAVSEVGLGTIKGISDLVDVVSSKVFGVTDDDYTNPVSEYLGQLQEDFKNYAPIYRDTDKNIFNGGLADAGWWASNLPSVMSSLTLMIPSTGITKGLGWIGKSLNAASKGKIGAFSRNAYKVMTGAGKAKTVEEAEKLNKVTKWLNDTNTIEAASRMAETGFNAALMRTMENYQEARQVYDDMKNQALDAFNNMSDEEYADIISKNVDELQGVDINNKEAVAKAIAKKSADRTFMLNYVNTVFDVIQLNALRNPIKLLKNMRSTSAINEADRLSKQAIGKAAANTMTDATEKSAGKLAVSKFGKGAYNFIKDSAVEIKAELSEGVEEAVNYIAQEEGMHYGNVALGEDIKNGFSSRLGSYLRSPELYDAAFWGIAGGVVFQGLGSGFNRIQVAIERKRQQDKKKGDKKTGEAVNTDSWQELFETSENKRRIADINKRTEDFNTLTSRLQQIGTEENPGTDPFNTDENGQPLAITTEVERDIARQKAISEYITNMTFRAMDNGNFDMLKSYLKDENIQQALNEATGNENDGGAFVQSLVNRMDHIADKYNNNLIALSNISRNINIAEDNTIPMEYLQIIARDNTFAQLRLEDINEQMSAYEISVANQRDTYGSKLDKSLNYKDTVQLVVLTQQLATLKAKKAELEKSKDKQGIGRQIELDKTNEAIRIVEDMIKGTEETSNSDALSRLIYATVQANMINDEELYAKNLSDLMAGNIKGILGERVKDFKTTDEELMKVFGEDKTSGSYATLASDINAVFEGAYGLNKIDKRLGDDYMMLAALNIEKAFLNQNIAINESSINKRVNELHNDMLDGRKKAINKAENILKELARKYGRETIANNLETGAAINWQSEEDKKNFDDALKMLNLTSATNQQLYDDIQNVLMYDELIRISQEAGDTSGESSTTSQNQKSEEEKPKTDSKSDKEEKKPTQAETTLNEKEKAESKQPKNKLPNDAVPIIQRAYESEDTAFVRWNNGNTMGYTSDGTYIWVKSMTAEEFEKLTGVKPTTISSTGGQEAKPSTPSSTRVDENGNFIPDVQKENVKREISETIRAAAAKAKKDNTDMIAAITTAAQELNTKYGNDEEFKQEINRISSSWANLALKKGWVVDVSNIVILASSIEEIGGKYKFTEEYAKQTRDFIDKFLKAANAKQFNDKTVVSFESILRFANEQMEDPTTAQYIYKMMKSWFKEGPDSNKYIVLDNMDSTSIFDRTSKTNKELVQERLGGTNIFRVQIDQFLEKIASKTAIDKLNVGDSLNAKLDNGDIILMSGDIEVGRLPKPQGDGNGGFKKTNNGWITDVKLSNGTVVSDIRKILEDILINKSTINDKINGYIYQIIAANKINGDTNPIKEAIEKDSDLTAYFNGLKEQGFIDKKANNVELINGLVGIWNYIDLTSPIEEERKADIAYSLNLWFNKLYDTYAAITNSTTIGLDNLTFKVAKITDGDVIQVAANDNEGYDKCTLGTENNAFADLETTEIGTVRPGAAGVIQTTANNNHSQPNSSTGTLWAVIPNRSGIPGIIRGHALRFIDRDTSISNTPAGRIRQAISNEFERRIKEFVNNDDYQGLTNFIEATLGSRVSTPLLAPIGGGKANVRRYTDDKGERIVISLKRADNKYVNFTINQDQRGYNFDIDGNESGYKGVDEINEFIKDFKTIVLGNSMFNADFKYFDSDADTSIPLSGLATRDKEGNFVITIPNGTDNPLVESFKSFKHFMMQGGGARWNTKNVNGTNFQPRSNNQLRNQVLNVSIETNSSRPVEEINQTSITPETIDNGEAITNLINTVFGNNSSAIKRLQDAGLIPSQIKYTSTISTKNGKPVTAEYISSKKQIYVNDKWIKLAKDNPERALRVLIHEQLHNKLHSKGNSRKEALNRVREIYNDFEKSLESLPNDAHIREYLFNGLPEEEALEEFLVESLTNRELASYLNSVKVDVPGQKTKKSILDKILELLADIFDWKVTEGSLYEKELKVLQGFTAEEAGLTQEENQITETTIEEEVIEETDEEYEDEFEDDDLMASSIEENTSPSVNQFVESLPLEERAEFSKLLLDGTVSMKCS